MIFFQTSAMLPASLTIIFGKNMAVAEHTQPENNRSIFPLAILRSIYQWLANTFSVDALEGTGAAATEVIHKQISVITGMRPPGL